MIKDLELINDIADFIAEHITTEEGVRVETIIEMVRDFDKKTKDDFRAVNKATMPIDLN